MIVVSDSSPITNLIHIEHEFLLEALFRKVLIPPTVHSELLRAHSVLSAFIETSSPPQLDFVRRLLRKVDLGEAEAIVLAKETRCGSDLD